MPSDPLGNYWERWVHPTQGVLHFQVHWKEEPPSEQKPGPEPPEERPKEGPEEIPPCATEATDEADWLETWGNGLEVELKELWKMQRNKDPQIKPRLSDFYERMSEYQDKLDEAIARFPSGTKTRISRIQIVETPWTMGRFASCSCEKGSTRQWSLPPATFKGKGTHPDDEAQVTLPVIVRSLVIPPQISTRVLLEGRCLPTACSGA